MIPSHGWGEIRDKRERKRVRELGEGGGRRTTEKKAVKITNQCHEKVASDLKSTAGVSNCFCLFFSLN